MIDCLVVGGGPAGLTTAMYLARYRRNILLIDKGHSRAEMIPQSHNYPGFSGMPALNCCYVCASRHKPTALDSNQAKYTPFSF